MRNPSKLGAAVLSAALLIALQSPAMADDTNQNDRDNNVQSPGMVGGTNQNDRDNNVQSPGMVGGTNQNDGDNHFDLQAHRGGIGLTVESTLASFAKGIDTGVSTLELDLQITKDGREVITHDRKISGKKCIDTAPVTQGDPQYPYVGKYVKDLTFAQVRSLDCGSLTQPKFPGQQASPRAKMPTLAEVFALADARAPGPAASAADPHGRPDQQGLPPGGPARQVAVARRDRFR
jgi:glycerophosphoryl diester phosphodiesterase